jgi:hypothetical protein
MSGFLIKRLLQAILRRAGGGPVCVLCRAPVRRSGADAGARGWKRNEDLQNIRTGLGLDRPFLVRYGDWARAIAWRRFGQASWVGTPIGAADRRCHWRWPLSRCCCRSWCHCRWASRPPSAQDKGVDHHHLAGGAVVSQLHSSMLVLLLSITFPFTAAFRAGRAHQPGLCRR